MNIARSSLKLSVANLLKAGVQFLGIAYFAQEIGASEIGIFFLFQALLGILSIPADFGLQGAIEKRISEGEDQGLFLSSVILLKIIPISLIIFLIIGGRSIINNYIGSKVALFLAIAIILNEGFVLSIRVLRGQHRVGETATLNLVRQVSWVGISALFVSVGLKSMALIYGTVISMFLMLIWGWGKVSISPSTPSYKHARSLYNFSKYGFITGLGGYIYNWLDIALIGLFLTQAHVGAYEVAWKTTAILTLFSRGIAVTIFPQISRWNATDKKDRIESIIPTSLFPSIILVIPAFLGIAVISDDVLLLIFGSEFTSASIVLIILAGEKVVQSIHVILSRVITGIDRPDLTAKSAIASIILNVILNIALIPTFGIVGAAVATTLSFSVNSLLHAYYLSNIIDINIPFSMIGWSSIASSIMGIIVYIIKDSIGIDNIFELMGVVVIGAIVYCLLILIIRPTRRQLKTTLRHLS